MRNTLLSEEERKDRDRERQRKQKAAKRAQETPEQRALRNSSRRNRNRIAQAQARANETAEQSQNRRNQDAAAHTQARANETAEQSQNRRNQDAAAHAQARANETAEQSQNRQNQDAAAHAQARANETAVQSHIRRNQDAAAHAQARAIETAEQTLTRQNRDAAAHAIAWANETPQQREDRQQRNARNLTTARNAKKTHVEYKDAMRTLEIFDGDFEVLQLEQTEDEIGSMTIECPDCGALRFPRETPSMCCQSGKVALPPFPKPPNQLLELWTGNDERSTVMRKFARTLNNAVCLTSLKNHAPRQEGWRPSVIFQGRVETRAGPLLPENGEQPRYSQLYVHDPSMESTNRFNNMTVPENMSEAQKIILREVLEIIQTSLHQVNPFIQDFKQIIEMPENDIGNGKIVISARAPTGEHARRYNLQNNLKEVSILTDGQPHDLILQKRGGGFLSVHDLNPKGQPLHFTLLFPYGTYGYDMEVKHVDDRRRVTPREYYTFYLNLRSGENRNYVHLTGRLFQEWLCMAWFLIENQRLRYQEQNQKSLRADTYKSVREITEERRRQLAPRTDGLYPDDHRAPTIGRKILSSSFAGGPRFMNAKFQDAMAIVREFHKPDYFITMTTNPNWPEIVRHLLPDQKPQDRPDIVARVFHLKKNQLMKDLTVGGLFGQVVAHLHVVEWQKRGLPHAHILIILVNHDRMVSAEMVDSLVVAELPPDPSTAPSEQARATRTRLEEIVLTNMLHGPCGASNPRNVCMENGRCTKGYPKPFIKETTVDPESYYATYRRRSPEDGGRTVQKGGNLIHNGMIVPYNPYLSLRYNCHINVEVCTSAKSAKYVFKYALKGNDRARVATEVEGEPRDEIREYQDLRCVGSSEAVYHIMGFELTVRYPAVQALRVHLKEQQQVTFDGDSEVEALERCRDTELTAFFAYNESVPIDERPSLPKYVDMPKTYVYNKQAKEWKIRQRDEVIGRVHTVHPLAGDAYYLRILLHDDHCRGKVSFEDLLALRGRTCETYKEVCLELGLLQDDREWQRILEEGAATKMCRQCRELFVIILTFCMPADPRALFDQFWETWTDDFEHRAMRTEVELTETQKKTMVLLDIELRLQSFEKQLAEFGLPVPTQEELQQVNHITSTEPAVIREERDFEVDQLQQMIEDRLPNLTPEQLEIYDLVLNAVNAEAELLLFIDARGGCGKTYLLNLILSAIRRINGGSTALAMATTGIAANLLALGRTFHSRARAPLTPTAESTLQITAQSSLAKLFRMSKLLMIDESTMLNRYLLEALHRTLQDLMGNDRPFGGKVIVLAGDFRQCLPVIPGATKGEIISQCINQSTLWGYFQIRKLSINMRVRALGDQSLQDFDDWSLTVGNGEMENLNVPNNMVACTIVPNSSHNTNSEGQSMEEFCSAVFPNLAENVGDPQWLDGRALLAVTNKEVNILNEVLTAKLPGNTDTLTSADQITNSQDLLNFSTEYLHSLCPNGFPSHVLRLKRNMPMMLLRNLNPREGLCNGTRLIYVRCIDNKLLECKIVGSMRTVLIPRITFIPTQRAGEFSIEWQRRQFPVRPAFAQTINKSQGQTLKMAGIWLRTQVIYKVESFHYVV